jgi:hypothetical protein
MRVQVKCNISLLLEAVLVAQIFMVVEAAQVATVPPQGSRYQPRLIA